MEKKNQEIFKYYIPEIDCWKIKNRIGFSFEKIAPIISLGLFLYTLLLTLIDFIFVSLGLTYNNLSNIYAILIIIILGGLYVLFPIYNFLNIYKKLPTELIDSYITFTALALLIANYLGKYVSDGYSCTLTPIIICVKIPGEFYVGLSFSCFLILFIDILAPKKLDLEKFKKYSIFKLEQIEKTIKDQILQILSEIEENNRVVQDKIDIIKNNRDFSIEKDIFKLNKKEYKLILKLFERRKQLDFFENKPELLKIKAEIAYKFGHYKKSMMLAKRANVNSKKKNFDVRSLIAKNLTRFENYKEAYEIFLDILENPIKLKFSWLIGKRIDYVLYDITEALSIVLRELNQEEARKAALNYDFLLLYEKLNISKKYKWMRSGYQIILVIFLVSLVFIINFIPYFY